MPQTYLRSAFKSLLAKKEAVSGTFETLAGATDAIPLEDADWRPNPVTRDSNEATNSIASSPTTVVRIEPTVGGTLQLHGSGAPATDPRIMPILESGGLSPSTAVVVPASGTTTAIAGTGNSFSINTAVATDWSAITGSYIGRVVQLGGNPAAGAYRVIKSYVVTATTAVVTFNGPAFSPVLSTSTTAKLIPGKLIVPSSLAVSTISVEHYLDGKQKRLSGGRANFGFDFPGNDIPKLTNVSIQGTHVSNGDASPTGVDFSTLPSAPDWSNGVCHLDALAVAATTMSMDLGDVIARHLNPNLPGADRAITTKRNVRGNLQINMELDANQDRVALLIANTDMAFSAVWDTTRTAGARMSLLIPRLRFLDLSYTDANGIADVTLPYQANGNDTLPEFYLMMCV